MLLHALITSHSLIRSETLHRSACLTFRLSMGLLIGLQGKSRNYYEILDVKPDATTKQIRKNFLNKARELHPDYNPAKEAQEEFRLLKQAYEVLKDKQKRYLYDTGVSQDSNVPPPEHSVWEGLSTRKYYENKWYSFKKSSYSDQRDDYYETKKYYNNVLNEDRWSIGGLYYRMSATLIFLLIIGNYDYLRRRKTANDIESEHVKTILQGPQQTKKSKMMSNYILQRSKHHAITDV